MGTPAVEIDRLSKRFERPWPGLRKLLRRRGPPFVDALQDVSLRVEPGEVFGLVGRNGQGKTTLIKSTCGLLEPSSGTVRVFGHDSVRDLRAVKRVVGLVSADERSFYYRLTGRENLRFFGRLMGLAERPLAAQVDALAATFELAPVLDRMFQEYSSGNKQRLAIARALLADPPLLLLDEPTRSLDPISAEALRRVVRSWAETFSKTVLITTHNLAEVEQLCARVAILSRGKLIACDTLEGLKHKYVARERVHVRVAGQPEGGVLEALCERFAGTLEPAASGSRRLSFTRDADDDRLHALLEALLAGGLRVVDVDTERFGLMQVLTRIEAEQGPPA